MPARLQSSFWKWVWRILPYFGGRHCKMMSSYRRSEGFSLGVRWDLAGRGIDLSCREIHRDLYLTASAPFLFLRALLARPRTSIRRTSRVELPMHPVRTQPDLSYLSFEPPHDRESWTGCSEVEYAGQFMTCIISTFASGRPIIIQV